MGNNARLLFICENRHEFRRTLHILKSTGAWCEYCNGTKIHVDGIRDIARKYKGSLLSTEYIGNSQLLLWQCESGHRFERSLAAVKNRGLWCSTCKGTRYCLDEVHRVAKERGGECLSEAFVRSSEKLIWKCAKGHMFDRSLSSVVNENMWCTKCKGTVTQLTLEDAKVAAQAHGGKCLSTSYGNANYPPLLWECNSRHRWSIKFSDIRQGAWCNACMVEEKRAKKLKLAAALAQSHGGKCLSENFINSKTNLTWICKSNHIWEANLNNIKYGQQWCPNCSMFKTQKKLASILEEIFGGAPELNYRKFEWLISDKAVRMEIDILFKDMKLGFEYDGEQHFKPVKYFGNISDEEAEVNFKRRKKLDKLKDLLVAKNKQDVRHFIRFNYKEPIERQYILEKLIKYRVPVPTQKENK